MTKEIYYEEGPDSIVAGEAGIFERGVAKPVPLKLADLLLQKPMFKEKVPLAPPAEGSAEKPASDRKNRKEG